MSREPEKRTPYEEAARLAIEGHPLPGEDLETRHADDAEHWVRVYRELVDFKAAMLSRLNERLESMTREATEEVRKTDAIVLEAEADRFRRRLALWEQKRGELLSASDPDAAP